MRILHMIPDIGVSNGVMSVILNYAKALEGQAVFDVVYFHETPYTRKNDIEALGGRVYKINAPSISTLISMEMKKFFGAHKDEWEALHIHAPHFAVFIAPQARLSGIKKIAVHCHSTWYSLKGNGKRNKILRMAGKPFCDTQFACGKDAGRFWYGNDKNFIILPNAIDCENYSFNEQIRSETRKKLGIEDKFVVGHLGRVAPPQKNHPFLIKIFAQIKKVKPNSVLMLAGAEQTPELCSLANELGVYDSIQFLGTRKDIPELLQAFDVFVFPSFKEGLPVSVVEAQAAGLPVLMADTITDEVCATDNIHKMALSESPEQWAQKALEISSAVRKSELDTMTANGWNIKKEALRLLNYYKTGRVLESDNSQNSSEPKRVLLVFGRLNRGGAETMAMNIYRNIDRSKLQFDFMVHTTDKCDYDDEILSLGGRIYAVPRYNIANHFKYKKCWDAFMKQHPEYKIVHAHMSGSAGVFLPICKKYGCYVISHSHTVAPKNGLRQVVVNSFRYPLRHISNYMFGCSDQAGEWMFGKKAVKKSNYATLKNGIDIETFAFSPEKRKRIREELNIEDKFVICNVARFDVAKNHLFLIDIFNELYKQNSNSILLLVGDGTLRGDIEKKIAEYNLQDSVILTGVRPDVDALLSASDVFAMPSAFEGLPVSLIEAQTNGLHIVATDVISPEIHITDLVELYSTQKGAKEWADILLKYSDGYKRKNTADKIIAAGYDIKTSAKQLEEFYLNI